jgi:hypothetical protein
MKRHGIAVVLLLSASLTGCEKVTEQVNAIRDKIPFLARKQEAPVPVAVVDTTAPAMADTTPVVQAPPAPAPRSRPAMVDEPWTPGDTGTVSPGMTQDEVVAVWGVPVAERTRGEFSFLYFRNGCEVTCGTFDVVFLENGQVVDAVVRAEGHTYAGNSSSPPGRMPEATPTQLMVPAQAPETTAPAPPTQGTA